ncbi:ETS homologous factor-like [Frankliniella occidentalis]|uniref:ETS homologous factor-like n=1 Tax=Frankliniella occidentalis TaxID=133901 RepID=A0A6J1RYP3_FRAOC|nr:ETS homologous factor-like [Frankliniella occidentalis]
MSPSAVFWDAHSPDSSPAMYSPASVYPSHPNEWSKEYVSQWLQRLLGPSRTVGEVQRIIRQLGQPCGRALLTLGIKEITQRVVDAEVGCLIHDALHEELGSFLGSGNLGQDFLDLDNADSNQRVPKAEWLSLQSSDELYSSNFAALSPPAEPRIPHLYPDFGELCGIPTPPGSDAGNQEVPECPIPDVAASPGLAAVAPLPASPERRRGGRPKRHLGVAPPARVRRRSGSGDGQPGKRLWQFILGLLRNPNHKSIIRWEDEEDGVFSFVDGSKVAELWGREKVREKDMDYEKMTRTMRTYKNGAFIRHPRRLFYKFGPKANWRETKAPSVDVRSTA